MVRRSILESLYRDTCDILTVSVFSDPVTKLTDSTYKALYTGVPCRLSIKNPYLTGSGDAALSQQVITLFINPDYDIPAGSRIMVHHFGKDIKFEQSGFPAVYEDHQEIELVYSEWA